ncbi:unnamed protein product [Eretmochelys imbricata]
MGRAGARWGLLADKVVFVMAPTEGALERHGGIDILVSNAAVKLFFGSMLDASEDVWNKFLDVSNASRLKAERFLSAKCFQHSGNFQESCRNRGGSIILVSSIAGFSPFLALGPYSVSKTALLGLRKALAPELGTRNIRTNCLAPGIVQTKFSSAVIVEGRGHKGENVEEPERLGVPSDCVGIVSFLCFPDTS